MKLEDVIKDVFNGELIQPAEKAPAMKQYTTSDITAVKQFYTERLPRKGFKNIDNEMFDLIAGFVSYAYTALGKRGLSLIGGTGNGKTTAVRAISALLDINFITANRLFELKKLDLKDNSSSFYDAIKPAMNLVRTKNMPCPYDIIIDDIGAERTITHFGDKLEMFIELIDYRYDLWKKHGAKTIITSNLSEEEMLQRYGARTMSRLKEMTTLYTVTGEDQRTKGE